VNQFTQLFNLPQWTISHSVQWWLPFSTEIAAQCQKMLWQVVLLKVASGNSGGIAGDFLAQVKR